MLFDLTRETSGQTRWADVCVIGAGPAGLSVCRALTERGLSVVLVDAGPQPAAMTENPSDINFDRHEYRGATMGRAFGFGGTSSLWGGQLLPILPSDMAARPHTGAPAWPIQYREIEAQYAALEAWLGVDALPFGLDVARQLTLPLAKLDWSGFAPRFSKWIPFSRRNLAAAWWDGIAATNRAQCWLNATVCEWHAHTTTGSIQAVTARTPAGGRLTVEANTFIVAAGAIESARLVLEMQSQAAQPREPNPALGGFLHDHLSIRIGEVELRNRAAFIAMFAPFFSGSTMRSPRFEVAPSFAREHGLPALYAHFVAEVNDNSGFAVVRDTLRALQRRRLNELLASGSRIPGAIPGIAEIAYWRYLKKRLPFPAGSRIFIHLDFEQPALATNCVRLGKAGGPLRRKGVRIDWHPGDVPVVMTKMMSEHLRAFWKRNGLDRIAELKFSSEEALRNSWPANLYDIYHPAGTTRMTLQPDHGVVGPDLRVFGTDNVHVLSTSVFPSMGAANPTFTLMALGLRLARHLAGEKPDDATFPRRH